MEYRLQNKQFLHEMLSESLSKSRKECCRLHGSICKMKSGQAVLMMRRDRAKKDLESYVNELSAALIDFRSEMLLTIREALNTKMNDLGKMREKFEERISCYLELCSEAEKLTQFGREIESQTDRKCAVKLIESFKSMLEESSVEEDQFADVMKLEFYPALQSSEIKPPMFGDLVAGTSYKPPSFALSVLRSRDCGQEHTSTLTDGKKSLEAVDIATQTEDDCIHKNNRNNTTDVQSDHKNAYNSACISKSNSSYARITPPPGMNCQPVSFPPVNFMNPPPGFSAHTPVNNMRMNMQMNPFLLGSNYGNTISPMYMQPLHVVSMSPPVQPEVPAIYKFGDIRSPSNFKFQAQQHSVPLSNSAMNVPELHSQALEPNSNVYKIGNNENLCVETIPLPMGPAPESNDKYTDKMSEDLSDRRNTFVMSKNQDLAKEQFENEKDSLEKYSDAKSTNEQSPKDNIRAKAVFETVENTLDVLASYDIERKVVEMKVDLDESDIQHEKINKSRLASDLLHSVVLRKKALMLETKDNIDFIQRTDEAENAMEPSEIDQEDMNRKLNNLEVNNTSNNEIKSCCNQDEEPVSFVSNDIKESSSNRTRVFFNFSSKPLRKPFPLTDNLLNMSKNKNSNSLETSCIPTTEDIRAIEPIRETPRKSLDVSKADFVFQSTPAKCRKFPNEQEPHSKCKKPVGKTACVSQENLKGRHGDGDEVQELLLDVSSPSVQTLRDSVSRNYPPSKKEMEKRNKEVLIAQRSWFKDYMQQKQVNAKRETKEDKENVSALTVNIKSEKGEQTDEKFDVSFNNSDDFTKEIKSSEEVSAICNQASEINPSVSAGVVRSLYEGKFNAKVKEEFDAGHTLIDTEVAKLRDKEVNEQKETDKQKEIEKQREENQQNDGDQEAPETVAASNVKDYEKTNDGGKKNGSQNITSNKDYLAEKKDVSKRSPGSHTKRLGALQAHWVGRRGTNVKAKHLFTCSCDFHYPIGVTTNMSGDIIVTDTGNHCIKMFNSEGKFLKTFGKKITPPLHRPSAVVVNEFNYIYVKDDLSIRVFDQSGEYVKSIGLKLFSKPFGLVLTPTKCLLVLETDRRNPALIHISQDGSQVWRYLYTPLTTAHPNSKCRFLTVSENNVIVSDLGLSMIYITTFEGIFLRTFGRFGCGRMEFCEPSGLSVDIYGNVVIGDSKNNRIQVYRHDGAYTGLIEFDESITRPSGIHLTKDNRLLVVNFLNHNVKVYEL